MSRIFSGTAKIARGFAYIVAVYRVYRTMRVVAKTMSVLGEGDLLVPPADKTVTVRNVLSTIGEPEKSTLCDRTVLTFDDGSHFSVLNPEYLKGHLGKEMTLTLSDTNRGAYRIVGVIIHG